MAVCTLKTLSQIDNLNYFFILKKTSLPFLLDFIIFSVRQVMTIHPLFFFKKVYFLHKQLTDMISSSFLISRNAYSYGSKRINPTCVRLFYIGIQSMSDIFF
jgi:hypothetical protein